MVDIQVPDFNWFVDHNFNLIAQCRICTLRTMLLILFVIYTNSKEGIPNQVVEVLFGKLSGWKWRMANLRGRKEYMEGQCGKGSKIEEWKKHMLLVLTRRVQWFHAHEFWKKFLEQNWLPDNEGGIPLFQHCKKAQSKKRYKNWGLYMHFLFYALEFI